MKRARIIMSIACIVTAIFVLSPLTSAITVAPAKTLRAFKETQFEISEPVRAIIGGVLVERYMSVDDMQKVIDIGMACKEDFLTIYNKQSNPEEVTQAFENVQPFFNALIQYRLTDKSVDDLNDLFHQIRDKIRTPGNQKWNYNPGDPQPAGLWNGVPTPIFANAGAGLFNVGEAAAGFVLGTHTILPTIGADILTTWTDTGETVTLGMLGFTTATGPEFGLILGFVGIMLCLPIMIIGFIFQVGFVGGYLGINILPF
jgi:hypothetical protein